MGHEEVNISISGFSLSFDWRSFPLDSLFYVGCRTKEEKENSILCWHKCRHKWQRIELSKYYLFEEGKKKTLPETPSLIYVCYKSTPTPQIGDFFLLLILSSAMWIFPPQWVCVVSEYAQWVCMCNHQLLLL